MLLLVRSPGRGHEKVQLDLLVSLNSLLREFPPEPDGPLVVLASDDYSMLAYSSGLSEDSSSGLQVRSEVEMFRTVFCLPVDRAALAGCIRDWSRAEGHVLEEPAISTLADGVLAVSGGHVGLCQALLADLGSPARGWTVPGDYWEHGAVNVLRSSSVLYDINQVLAQDRRAPAELCRKALAFAEPDYPSRYDAQISLLKQLGILQPHSSSAMLRLCPGEITRVIREMVNRLAPAAPASSPRRKPSRGEPRFLSEKKIADPAEEDLVVVHLSDLHVGPEHGFKVKVKGKILNDEAEAAADRLERDLGQLGLIGRVNALIASGDFVCKGAIDHEFAAAHAVVKDILEKIRVKREALVLIPGNHDIEFDGSGQPQPDPTDDDYRRAHYLDFHSRLAERDLGKGAELTTVTARSGASRLRILGLDSNAVEGPTAPGIGFVSRQALRWAEDLLQLDTASHPEEPTYTWMVVHHHVFPASSHKREEAGRKRISVLANAAEILAFAARKRIELILHGHEHQPSLSLTSRWPLEGQHQFYSVASLGAGSFSVHSDLLGPIRRHHYYIIYRRPKEILIRSRWSDEPGRDFISHRNILLPR